MDIISNWALSFLAGLLSPLGAVCVLPLYPGFLSYLAGSEENGGRKVNPLLLGIIITAGIMTAMLAVGFLFVFLLKESLSSAAGIISRAAFILLLIISIFLITGISIPNKFPSLPLPRWRNKFAGAFLYGILFGFIIIPCNPAPMVVVFGMSTTVSSFLSNLVSFFLFGFGMALPLLAIAVISLEKGQMFTKFLITRMRALNFVTGIFMAVIALYYLFFVF